MKLCEIQWLCTLGIDYWNWLCSLQLDSDMESKLVWISIGTDFELDFLGRSPRLGNDISVASNNGLFSCQLVSVLYLPLCGFGLMHLRHDMQWRTCTFRTWRFLKFWSRISKNRMEKTRKIKKRGKQQVTILKVAHLFLDVLGVLLIRPASWRTLLPSCVLILCQQYITIVHANVIHKMIKWSTIYLFLMGKSPINGYTRVILSIFQQQLVVVILWIYMGQRFCIRLSNKSLL